MVREYNSTSAIRNSSSFQGTFICICSLTLSRKAKDYTELYGEGLDDENGSVTRHLKDAFVGGCHKLTPDKTHEANR